MVRFSQSAGNMRTSEIRDLMSLATKPGIISFAGGMPGNDLFPTTEIDEIYQSLPVEVKQQGFQYGPTPGYPPLLEALTEYLRAKGLPVDSNKLMITTGSLQAINIAGKIFLDPGDTVITENPCFIGGISAFKSYQAELAPVPMDENGIIIEEMDKVFSTKNPRLVYVTPYFHNPAGLIYSSERKSELLDYLADKEIAMLEDDPYGELYFHEDDKPLTVPMKTKEPQNPPILYTGSFSKILGPGMRLGWLLAPPEIMQKAELAKQSMDACSPTFTQILANEFVRQGKLQPYLERMRAEYKMRKEKTVEVLRAELPPEISFVEPRGGFYLWLQLPEGVDATEILKASIDEGAVFIVGKTFDPHGVKNDCIRLAFSHTPAGKIQEGVSKVIKAVKKFV